MGHGASVYRDATHPGDLSTDDTRAHLAKLLMHQAAAEAPRVHVVVDGMNVAMGNVPSYETDPAVKRAAGLQGLQLAIEFFSSQAIPFKIFAPRGWVDDHPELGELLRAQVLFVTPGGLDDNFMIAHADNHGSFIVSNDRFHDHVARRGYDQRWLDYHRVAFMFDPSFAPDPDALERMRCVHEGRAPDSAAPRKARLRSDAAVSEPRNHRPVPSALQQNHRSHSNTNTKADTPAETPAAAAAAAAATLLMEHHPMPDLTASPVAQASRINAPRTVVIAVPRGTVGRIIGKRGAQIHTIETATACKLDVSKQPLDDPSETTEITLRGPPEAQQAAAREIQAIVDACSSAPRAANHHRQNHYDAPGEHDQYSAGLAHDGAVDLDDDDHAMDVS